MRFLKQKDRKRASGNKHTENIDTAFRPAFLTLIATSLCSNERF